jgi:hypothetical protein
MSTLKLNDIVLITSPADSPYINLFGKIKEKKLENVDGIVNYIFYVFIDIQGNIEKFDSINLEKLVDQKLGETMFMLQSLTSDHLKNALQFCTFTDLFNMYCLNNSYINDAFNGREGIKIDFRNDNSDDKFLKFSKYRQLYSTQNRIYIMFDELIEKIKIKEWDVRKSLGETELHGCINLKSIEFEDMWDQHLGKSLHGLINLEEIYFYGTKDTYDYTEGGEPLEDSLHGLINLRVIQLEHNYNYPLENSLHGLTNLREIYFGTCFDTPLEDSLDRLINLQELYFGFYYNQPLDGSLYFLKNLRIIEFGSCFDKPLEDSLDFLQLLKILKFGTYFNRPLEDSLHHLLNLQELHFGAVFNQPLKDSLYGLCCLKILQFGGNFNQPLESSLNGLLDLEELYFGKCFDNGGETLSIDTFVKCRSLKKIKFPDTFKEKLSKSLLDYFNNDGIKIDYWINKYKY